MRDAGLSVEYSVNMSQWPKALAKDKVWAWRYSARTLLQPHALFRIPCKIAMLSLVIEGRSVRWELGGSARGTVWSYNSTQSYKKHVSPTTIFYTVPQIRDTQINVPFVSEGNGAGMFTRLCVRGGNGTRRVMYLAPC